MIFGHELTSHGIKLEENVFVSDGCVQVQKRLPSEHGHRRQFLRSDEAQHEFAPLTTSPSPLPSPLQNRGDKGGIAIMCPGGHKPDGLIADNHFFTCPNISGSPAIYVNPAVPGCADNMTMTNNTIAPAADPDSKLVAMPQVSAHDADAAGGGGGSGGGDDSA